MLTSKLIKNSIAVSNILKVCEIFQSLILGANFFLDENIQEFIGKYEFDNTLLSN